MLRKRRRTALSAFGPEEILLLAVDAFMVRHLMSAPAIHPISFSNMRNKAV